MRVKLKFNKYIVLYLLIAFIPRVVLIQYLYPFVTPLDESSTLALPAYLAGCDWSYLMGKTRFYYGYGMAVLFTPIFILIKNPILLYRAILTACAVLQVIPGLIAFHILGKFFNQTNQIIKLLLALIASFCVFSTATTVANEHMLYIIAWMLGWMLLELLNCKCYREKCIYTGVLMVIAFYALTCHERSIVFLIAIICVVIAFGLFERKLLISLVTFLIVSSFVFKITTLLTDKVQLSIWPVESTEAALTNTLTAIPIKVLGNSDLWSVWYNIVLGQLGTGAVFTGGTLLIGIIFGIWMFIRKVISLKWKYEDVEKNYFYVILFGLLTIGAMIFAQSLTGLENANYAVSNSRLSEGGRVFTYLRYYFPCVSMVIVLSLNWLITNIEENFAKRIIIVSFMLVGLLQTNFIWNIIPLIERTPVINYVHNTYWIFSFMKDGDWTCKYTFLPGCIICVLFSGFFLLLIIKRRKKTALCILVLLLGYQYIMRGIALNIPKSVTNYSEVKDTCAVLTNMREDDVLPNYIGITGERIASTKQPTRFIYQFFLRDYGVSYYEPVEEENEAIYITYSEKIPFSGITEDTDNWYRVKLTERQYIFFKGARLEAFFEQEGYNYILVE